ncbi:MotA/TolQ/ExbB proton channel family protein [Gimesia maris]|uniref:MotA/TolQ/ExbB proton channel family protein n=1 Tax=Gimesia maris TaxID=122 RepID=UPI00118989FC|nr:MotA/TolQ/ExbB proton channel family protein [Gimesia maris]QDT78257.1 MotA/TolQ/ExbB proton channel family protein [Gimesia maris]
MERFKALADMFLEHYEMMAWSALIGFGVFTAFAVVERTLYVLCNPPAHPFALEQFCRRLTHRQRYKCGDQISPWNFAYWCRRWFNESFLGWLESVLLLTYGNTRELRIQCHRTIQDAERFRAFLRTMKWVCPAQGMIGTVFGFMKVSGAGQDFVSLFSFAFETTFVGLLIALPAALAGGLYSQRINTLQAQALIVLDAIERNDTPDLDVRDVVGQLEMSVAPVLDNFGDRLALLDGALSHLTTEIRKLHDYPQRKESYTTETDEETPALEESDRQNRIQDLKPNGKQKRNGYDQKIEV